LYRDLFDWQQVRRPKLLEDILQALALQIGHEVSFLELAQLVGADKETVERYIDLLEKSFVIFRLGSLSRNLRSELKRARKIYFWDIGVRNAIIKNFNPLNLRSDFGALWENFLVAERTKRNASRMYSVNRWFWRTHTQQEVDYVEEAGGQVSAFEFKWTPPKSYRFPNAFREAYPAAQLDLIHRENFIKFLE